MVFYRQYALSVTQALRLLNGIDPQLENVSVCSYTFIYCQTPEEKGIVSFRLALQ